jgi:excisionase family DNA binding protein
MFRTDPTSDEEIQQLATLDRFLRTYRRGEVTLTAYDSTSETLPDPVYEALRQLVSLLARTNAVTLVSYPSVLTTSQAARLLNVSRPHLIQLLNDHKMRFTWVGTHRRVPLEDVLAYRQATWAEFGTGMAELMSLSRARRNYDESAEEDDPGVPWDSDVQQDSQA